MVYRMLEDKLHKQRETVFKEDELINVSQDPTDSCAPSSIICVNRRLYETSSVLCLGPKYSDNDEHSFNARKLYAVFCSFTH